MIPRRIFPRIVPATLLVALAVLAGCRRPQAETAVVVKVSWPLPADHPTSEAMGFFEQRVEELSGGRIDVRLFPNSQLGTANESIVGCQNGNIEAAVVSAAPLAQFADVLNVVVMPFVFRDAAHQYAVLDGDAGRVLDEQIERIGVVALAWFDAGSRNVMTKQGPVTRPEDLAGLKIRVMDSAALRDAVNALGAAAQPMSQGEVYSALQTGVIDGWENNPATCLAFSMHETGCKHFAWTRHVSIPDILIVGRAFHEGLPPDLKDVLRQAALETRERQRTLWRESEGRAVAALEQGGMIFNEVDHDAFLARFEGFYDRYRAKHGAVFSDLLDRIQRTGGTAP